MDYNDLINEISEEYEFLREEIFNKLINSEFEEGTELFELDKNWDSCPYDDSSSNADHYLPIIDGLSQDDALSVFRISCTGQKSMPDSVLKIIASKYPSDAKTILTAALSDDVLSLDWTVPDRENDTKINEYSEALEYFQKFYPQEAYEFAAERFCSCPYDNEALLESFANAIVSVMDEAGLIEKVRGEENVQRKHALMYGICSSMRRSDALFMLLKTEFKKAPFEDKMEYGYILSVYDDGRAVPVLRKYALDLQEKWIQAPADEKEEAFSLFSQARELVEDLGGSIDD